MKLCTGSMVPIELHFMARFSSGGLVFRLILTQRKRFFFIIRLQNSLGVKKTFKMQKGFAAAILSWY